MKTLTLIVLLIVLTVSAFAQVEILKPVGTYPDSKASRASTDANEFIIKGGSGTTFCYDTLQTISLAGLDSVHIYITYADSANAVLLIQGLQPVLGTNYPGDTVATIHSQATPVNWYATITGGTVSYLWFNCLRAAQGHDGALRPIIKFDPDVTAMQARASKGIVRVKKFVRAK